MKRLTVVLAVLATTLAVGVSAGLGALTSPRGARSVNINLTEMSITPGTVRVSAGKVTFSVKNAGKITHELVVIRTAKAASNLSVSSGRASEAGHVGETGDMAAGASKKLSLTLTRGHYVLLCNVAGHYQAGMRGTLVVS
jgi:uncharacterized cupredoxin-like copper-binding protein